MSDVAAAIAAIAAAKKVLDQAAAALGASVSHPTPPPAEFNFNDGSWCTPQQAADILRLHVDTIYEKCRKIDGFAVKVKHGNWWIRKSGFLER